MYRIDISGTDQYTRFKLFKTNEHTSPGALFRWCASEDEELKQFGTLLAKAATDTFGQPVQYNLFENFNQTKIHRIVSKDKGTAINFRCFQHADQCCAGSLGRLAKLVVEVAHQHENAGSLSQVAERPAWNTYF